MKANPPAPATTSAGCWAWACRLALCLAAIHSHCQHLAVPSIADQDDSYYANFVMAWGTLVARGQFIGLCEDVSTCDAQANGNLFERRLATVRFRLDEVFKGHPDPAWTADAGDVASVPIRLTTDLLAYPGETITRYEKRKQLATPLLSTARELDDELDDMRRARRTEEPAYQDLRQQRYRIHLRLKVLRPVQVTPPEGRKMIWDLDGSIRSDVDYLVSLRPDDDGRYAINALFDGSIWWGDQAERIAALLREVH